MEKYYSGLKKENNGELELALIDYRAALAQVKRFHFERGVRRMITRKITVLETVIRYEKQTQ